MKLVGKVSKVDRTVAKINKEDGSFEEKRVFQINARPASDIRVQYAYAGLNFTAHGQELQDLGIDLNDEVDIFVVKKGEEYSHRQIEEVSSALYEAQNKLNDMQAKLEQVRRDANAQLQRANEASNKGAELQRQNVSLLIQIEALKEALADKTFSSNLKQIEG